MVLGRYCPVNFDGLSMRDFNTAHGEGTADSRSLYVYGFRGLDRIVFETAAQFDELAESYTADASARQCVQREMHDLVQSNFTYAALVPQVLDHIRSEFARE